MKKIVLIASMLVTVSASSFAAHFPIDFNMGIMGCFGGCFPGPGMCVDLPGAPGEFLNFNEVTGALTFEVTPLSAQYNEFSGNSFEFSGDSYLSESVVDAMGLGGSTIYIKAGAYSISDDGSGTKTIQVDYEIVQ
ncbi:MAG: hypothetical protein KDC07_03815 [Chitinophagaceae bacterium]|nr:hypothetical protein [Chitinophagaceae bacterium]MCB9047009.1 hypothetical protein [Chitinophagales bacterium]